MSSPIKNKFASTYRLLLRKVIKYRVLIAIISFLFFVNIRILKMDDKYFKTTPSDRPQTGEIKSKESEVGEVGSINAESFKQEDKDLYSHESNSKNEKLNEANSQNEIKDPIEENDEYEGWMTVDYASGSTPNCFNFSYKKDRSINNKLTIKVGNNTDVVIKLMELYSNICIRYVYVRAGQSYDMKNIPEGLYYVKIAYGKKWMENNEGRTCVGKFTQGVLYKKGSSNLDFNKQYNGVTTDEYGDTYENWNIPSYSLSLDVISSYDANSFKTNSISEDEFND